MGKNRTEDPKHKVKGPVIETMGTIIGNATKEAADNIDTKPGKVQKEIGKATETLARVKWPTAVCSDASEAPVMALIF